MRIAVVTDEFPPLSRGGSGIVAYREARALIKQGHEVLVFAPGQQGRTVIDSINVHFVNHDKAEKSNSWKILYDQWLIKILAPLVSEFKPDVVHCHHLTSNFGLRTLAWCVDNYRTVITIHDANFVIPNKVFINIDGSYGPGFWTALKQYHLAYNPFLKFFAGRLLGRAQKVIFVSDAIRRYYEYIFGTQSNYVTLHNALDLDEWRLRPYVPTDTVRVGFASRLTGSKGWRTYLDLLSEMNRLGCKTIGSVIGDETKVKNAISLLDERIKPFVEYFGEINNDDELRDWYGDLDAAFVGSTYVDPYPNVAIEVLAVGRGVIIGPHTGSREIGNQDVGYLMQTSEIEDVSKMANYLARSKPFKSWAQNSETVRGNISMDKHVEALLKIYSANINYHQ